MASRGGPTVEGTDGTDFMHRQRVASQYQLSALNKSRLKSCIFVHILLFFILLLKLTPDVLDRLDIFVLELEELEVPKPLKWEFWYIISFPVAFVGLSAVRRNNIQAMQIYLGGTIANAVVPVLLGMYTYFGDVYTYVNTKSMKDIQVWQGYPYGVLWYIFLLIAMQVHVFSIIFASKLVTAWRLKGSGAKKTE
ncbi:Protein jagunal [Orchesella cincta]|uniref:Protein jagunal n=1 Tax=Orchesella cincta TaxID=48709 RepID=A0A1D2NMQ4_ORCCI|nr:Protein jagunal [Orchesella cincta]